MIVYVLNDYNYWVEFFVDNIFSTYEKAEEFALKTELLLDKASREFGIGEIVEKELDPCHAP